MNREREREELCEKVKWIDEECVQGRRKEEQNDMLIGKDRRYETCEDEKETKEES